MFIYALAMSKIFVSHASVDNRSNILDGFYEMLALNHEVFYSSLSNAGIALGEYLHKEINKQIHDCDICIAFITGNYLKSQHCIYELSIARYLSKTVIAIYSDVHVKNNISQIADSEWISIDLNGQFATPKQVSDLVGVLSLDESCGKEIENLLNEVAAIKKDDRAYIGMSQVEFNNLLLYCQNNGITKFGNGAIYDDDTKNKKISESKNIYIIATTGAALYKTLKQYAIPQALRNGASVNIIIPDLKSQFCEDVALCECYRDNAVIQSLNSQRIQHEFSDSILFLNQAYANAKGESYVDLGTIRVYCCGTLLRQTLVMAELENEYWGWITMTMPPLLTSNTPSIAFQDSKDKKYESIGKVVEKHCKCLMSIAEKRYQTVEITGNTIVKRLDRHSYNASYEYWTSRYESAVNNVANRKERFTLTLIEVSSQHPLKNGKYPNKEFAARLDHAIELFKKNPDDCVIYVPGSRHRFDNVNDDISLSESGVRYLLEHDIPVERIWGDEVNMKYMGEAGVYNSADECFAASRLYADEKCGRLICICSPYQIMRKTLYYLEFGILPECHGVTLDSMYHNPVAELFSSLYSVAFGERNWQDPESRLFINSRKERQP